MFVVGASLMRVLFQKIPRPEGGGAPEDGVGWVAGAGEPVPRSWDNPRAASDAIVGEVTRATTGRYKSTITRPTRIATAGRP